MSTLENRPNTALLVVDVQTGVVKDAYERGRVVANIGSLVEKARRERVAVIWVQHSDEQLALGSDDWAPSRPCFKPMLSCSNLNRKLSLL